MESRIIRIKNQDAFRFGITRNAVTQPLAPRSSFTLTRPCPATAKIVFIMTYYDDPTDSQSCIPDYYDTTQSSIFDPGVQLEAAPFHVLDSYEITRYDSVHKIVALYGLPVPLSIKCYF